MNRISLKRIFLALVVLLVFGRGIFHDWVDWDDNGLICKNENLNPPNLAGLLRPWEPRDPSNCFMYDPVVYTTWWILAHAAYLNTPDNIGSALNPMVFHAANIAVHICSALVVLEILRRLGMRDGPALAGAMLFAIHPIQTEAVLWATGMKDLLCGLFALLAIWRYITAASTKNPRSRRLNYYLATAAYLAALLAKPSAVSVPLMVAAIDLILIRRSWKQTALWIAPWLALALAFTLLASAIQPTTHVDPGPLWSRPLVAADAIAFYLYKLVWPIHFYIIYGRTPHALLTDPEFHYPLRWTWLIPVTLALILWLLRRRELTLAALLFLFGVLPVLGLVTFVFQYYSTVADRYMYLSMLGVALALAWFMRQYRGRLTTILVTCLLILLGCDSFAQADFWKDSKILFSHVLKFNPKFAHAYVVRGEYEILDADTEGRLAAVASTANESRRHRLLQEAYVQDAIAGYRKALELDPWSGFAYDTLSTALLKDGHPAEAAAVLREYIQRWPNIPEWDKNNLNLVRTSLGMLYENLHQYQQAIDQFQQIPHFRDDPTIMKHLGEAKSKLAATQPATEPQTISP